MRFTVNTNKKTIHIHGSFTFDEFELMKERLHPDYKTYRVEADTPDNVQNYFADEEVLIGIFHLDQKLLSNPPYPVGPVRKCCGNCTACPYSMTVT